MNKAMNTMNASAGNTIRNEMIAVHFKYVGMYPIVLPPGELGATVSVGCITVAGGVSTNCSKMVRQMTFSYGFFSL